MYAHIIAIANKRLVTANDFEPYIGCHNWLTMDNDSLPEQDRVQVGNLTMDSVCEFSIRRVFLDNGAGGTVEILYYTNSHPGGIAYHLSADELAIRMEDS